MTLQEFEGLIEEDREQEWKMFFDRFWKTQSASLYPLESPEQMLAHVHATRDLFLRAVIAYLAYLRLFVDDEAAIEHLGLVLVESIDQNFETVMKRALEQGREDRAQHHQQINGLNQLYKEKEGESHG